MEMVGMREWMYMKLNSDSRGWIFGPKCPTKEEVALYKKISTINERYESFINMYLVQERELEKFKELIFETEVVEPRKYKLLLNQQLLVLVDTIYSNLERTGNIHNKNHLRIMKYKEIVNNEANLNEDFWVAKEIRNYLIHNSVLFQGFRYQEKNKFFFASMNSVYKSCRNKKKYKPGEFKLERMSNKNISLNQFEIFEILESYFVSSIKILADVYLEYKKSVKEVLETFKDINSSICIDYDGVVNVENFETKSFSGKVDFIFLKDNILEIVHWETLLNEWLLKC